MENITRHAIEGINNDFLQRSLERLDQDNYKVIQDTKSKRLEVFADRLLNLYYESEFLGNKSWAEKFLFFSSELNRIMYFISNNNEKLITLTYANQSTQVVGWLVANITRTFEWVNKLDLAYITRNHGLIEELKKADYLQAFGNEILMDESVVNYRKDILLNKSAEDCLNSLRTTFKLFEKDLSLNVNDPYYHEYLKMPVHKCYEALLLGDDKLLNERLMDGLEKHYEYCYVKNGYMGSDIKYSNYRSTWVSLPLLAVCCQAYDAGMEISVKSDYIPEWIIKKDFQYELKKFLI